MPHFDLVTDPAPDSELQDLYVEIVDAGFAMHDQPLNWFRSLAARPDLLRAAWGLVRGLLVEGELPACIKQMIVVAISSQNRCRYCEITHTGALHALGIDEATIRSCASDPELLELSSPHREAVALAVRASDSPQSVSADDLAVLKDKGLREGEIMEVLLLAAFTSFVNTWADAVDVPLDGHAG